MRGARCFGAKETSTSATPLNHFCMDWWIALGNERASHAIPRPSFAHKGLIQSGLIYSTVLFGRGLDVVTQMKMLSRATKASMGSIKLWARAKLARINISLLFDPGLNFATHIIFRRFDPPTNKESIELHDGMKHIKWALLLLNSWDSPKRSRLRSCSKSKDERIDNTRNWGKINLFLLGSVLVVSKYNGVTVRLKE